MIFLKVRRAICWPIPLKEILPGENHFFYFLTQCLTYTIFCPILSLFISASTPIFLGGVFNNKNQKGSLFEKKSASLQ